MARSEIWLLTLVGSWELSSCRCADGCVGPRMQMWCLSTTAEVFNAQLNSSFRTHVKF
jgi:hypothetical protein